MVRVHGQERKYTCEYCGTQFIHQKHWRRHMNKHQNNPEKIYRTQPVRRGYTKNTSEYWQAKPGQIGPPESADFPALTYPDTTQIPMTGVPVAPFHGNPFFAQRLKIKLKLLIFRAKGIRCSNS